MLQLKIPPPIFPHSACQLPLCKYGPGIVNILPTADVKPTNAIATGSQNSLLSSHSHHIGQHSARVGQCFQISWGVWPSSHFLEVSMWRTRWKYVFVLLMYGAGKEGWWGRKVRDTGLVCGMIQLLQNTQMWWWHGGSWDFWVKDSGFTECTNCIPAPGVDKWWQEGNFQSLGLILRDPWNSLVEVGGLYKGGDMPWKMNYVCSVHVFVFLSYK